MNKRYAMMPIVIMLIAGGIAGLMTLYFSYESIESMWIILGSLVLFYVIGRALRWVILRFEQQIADEEAKRLEEEGKVVEKEGAAENTSDNESDRESDKEEGDSSTS